MAYWKSDLSVLVHPWTQMQRSIGFIFIALLAALLFFVAVGYHEWPCKYIALGPKCKRYRVYENIGALLLNAGLLIFLAAILSIIALAADIAWSFIVAMVFTPMSKILTIIGVFNYLHSPFIDNGTKCRFSGHSASSLQATKSALLITQYYCLFQFIQLHYASIFFYTWVLVIARGILTQISAQRDKLFFILR